MACPTARPSSSAAISRPRTGARNGSPVPITSAHADHAYGLAAAACAGGVGMGRARGASWPASVCPLEPEALADRERRPDRGDQVQLLPRMGVGPELQPGQAVEPTGDDAEERRVVV